MALLRIALNLCLTSAAVGDRSLLQYAQNHLKDSRLSLSASSWPVDHGDVSRSKFSINHGLPRDIELRKLVVQHKQVSSKPQWIYTYGPNSEYIFIIAKVDENKFNGSAVPDLYVIQKLRSSDLELLQSHVLAPSVYLGGMLMHANGHVYCVHSNILYVFYNGDLDNNTSISIPTSMNGKLTSTNGLSVTSDGYLVVKQWSFLFEDALSLNVAVNPTTRKLVFALYIIAFIISLSMTLLKLRCPKHMPRELFMSLLINLTISVVLVSVLIMVLVCLVLNQRFGGYALFNDFNPLKFLFTNLLPGDVLVSSSNGVGGGGQLKIIHPITLDIVADMELPERCSYARMALHPIYGRSETKTRILMEDNSNESPNVGKNCQNTHEGQCLEVEEGVKVSVEEEEGQIEEDAIVLLGDEHVYQIRWHLGNQSLRLLPRWTQRYRSRGDGSYPGTGPAIYNGTAYFTDNTFAGLLFGHTFKLFSVNLEEVNSRSPCSGSNQKLPPCPKLAGVHLTDSKPGFFFWSAVISPAQNDVIVWDTGSGNIQARSLTDLSLHWEVQARNADCVTVGVSSGHVYASDYSDGPTNANSWMAETVSKPHERKFSLVNKFFLVIDAESGKVISNVTIAENQGMFVSMIIPGGHDDIILGTDQSLVRVEAVLTQPDML